MSKKWIKPYHDNHYIFNGFRDKCAEHAAVIHSDDAFEIYQELHAIFGKDWIACSEQMPEIGQDVVLGWYDELSEKITPDLKTTYHLDNDESHGVLWIDNGSCDPDYFLEVNKPSHYHPIPTL